MGTCHNAPNLTHRFPLARLRWKIAMMVAGWKALAPTTETETNWYVSITWASPLETGTAGRADPSTKNKRSIWPWIKITFVFLLLQSKIDLRDRAWLCLLSSGAAVSCELAHVCRWNLVSGINGDFDGRDAKASCCESTACCFVMWPKWLLCNMVEGSGFFDSI